MIIFSQNKLFPDGTAALPSIAFSNDTATGFSFLGTGDVGLSINGVTAFEFETSGLRLSSDDALQWGSSGVASPDLALRRDAANTLAQRNGTNAQESRIYNTDNGANDEFASLGWINTSNVFSIEPEKTGSGTLRGLNLCAAAGSLGFYGTTPTAQQTGVAVSAAGIHAALVTLGLITA